MHHYTLHNEVVKSMKEVEDIHQDILKLLEENTLQLMTQPINNIHENGE
jgi:regulator of replication initiation timing